MLGLSFSHILVVVLVIVVLWRGQKILSSIRGHLNEPPPPPRAARRPKARGAKPAQPTDLVECPRCGTYVPNGTICRSIEECVLKPKESARSA
jgi:ribosomal protein L32